jgi:hypothetical protein
MKLMFHCRAGHLTEPGDRAIKIVVNRRDRLYPYHPDHQKKPGGSLGWEIVKEALMCKQHVDENLKEKYNNEEETQDEAT